MKAAVVHSFDKPLEIEDVPIPEPGPEQVLVRIEASGLCHTDIHAARGEWPVKPTPPFIPGHEGVGIVERLGSGNSHGIEVGMRVALPWLGYACGDCRYCNSGRETLCESQLNMGYAINGGFAEYAVGYARHVVQVPAGIDPADAAPLTCAGVTTYKAVKVADIPSPASLVAVFGAGGLGHLAIQYARIMGASVVAVDTNEARLASALELGAEHVVHAGEQDVVAAIKALGGADAAISTAVNPIAFEQAQGSLARGGTLVCVGLPAENGMTVPIFETVLGGLTLRGSIVGTHHDLEEVFALHKRGLTTVFKSEIPLDDVNEAIERVLDGTAPSPRMVFRMSPVDSADHSFGQYREVVTA
jgi:alcohol dehydrogenase, propanol-preferring